MRRLSFSTRARISLPVLLGLLATLTLAGCGGSSEEAVTLGVTGSVRTTLSDPPTCKGPLAPSDLQFNHVWVTVTQVRAHISASAEGSTGGWVTLADLTSNPMQIDLLDTQAGECVLATLGLTSGLPAGNYQQIRLHLLSNNPPGGTATPSPNNCASVNGFNCAELVDGTLKLLNLSSQAQSGLKIPPGQIAGGGLQLEAGQSADINIEFNACKSIVEQGNGQLRLLPTLHAGEVSTSSTLSGRIVNRTNGTPLSNATVVVYAEQPDADGIDRVVFETLANSADATFNVCPVPMGSFDLVAAAIDQSGVTYNATVLFNVSAGTNVGDIPLEPEPGPDTSPATLQGQVTTAATSGATGADIKLAALQEADKSGTLVRVTIPLFGASTPNVATEAGATCPAGTECADYTLIVPASNPVVGVFNSAGTTYTGPAAAPVNYRVNARAFLPGTSDPNCTPSAVTTDLVAVTAGMTTMVPTIAFTGCAAGN